MLYVVATPIGNLGDVTLRALEILKSVDLVAAEDTTAFRDVTEASSGSRSPSSVIIEHNEAMRTAELVVRLADGENIALITDAGTPGLSDPGARLVRECIQTGAFIYNRSRPIIDPDRSCWVRIFDSKNFASADFFQLRVDNASANCERPPNRDETVIFFESPYRLSKTLAACVDVMPERQLCVARELTKKFEEFRRGTAGELLAHYEAHPPKGEIVLVISGS